MCIHRVSLWQESLEVFGSEIKRNHIFRDVVFYEHIFPFVNLSFSQFLPLSAPDFTDTSFHQTHNSDTNSPEILVSTLNDTQTECSILQNFSNSDSPVVSLSEHHNHPSRLRRSSRLSKLPSYLNNYIHHLHAHCTDSFGSCTITSYCNTFTSVSSSSICCVVNSSLPDTVPETPSSYTEAIGYP